MNEIVTTVVGRLTNHPVRRQVDAGREVVTFRMACNHRYFDRGAGEWREASTSYLTVDCWRRNLGRNIMASVVRGNPVIVHGRLLVREYEQEGRARTAVTLVADAVGPDLNHAMAALTAVRHNTDPNGAEAAAQESESASRSADVPGAGGADSADPVRLPVSRRPGGDGSGVLDAAPAKGEAEEAAFAPGAREPVEDPVTAEWLQEEPGWAAAGNEAAVPVGGASPR